MWNSLKADAQFCVLAIRREYAESKWYKIMSTAYHRTNKIISTVVGSGIVTLIILFIYTNYEFLLRNKRWVAIIVLSVLSMFLMWVAMTVRRFHERTVGELNGEISDLENELPAKDKLIDGLRNSFDLLGVSIKSKSLEAQWAKERYEREISRLKSEVIGLKGQLNILKTYKLKFEIDVPRSKLTVTSYYDEQFSVRMRLYIRFENTDIHPLTVKSINVLLLRANEDGTESEIPLVIVRGRDDQELYEEIFADEHPLSRRELKWKYRDLSVPARTPTLFHRIDGHISADGYYQEILNSNCFLRVTMDAMNQPPYSLDFNVKWQNTGLGWIDITPRM
jgi:hypothetical protein